MSGDGGRGVVSLINHGPAIAFMVHLRLVDSDGVDMGGIVWADNFLTLWPGETLSISVEYPVTTQPMLVTETWNDLVGAATPVH